VGVYDLQWLCRYAARKYISIYSYKCAIKLSYNQIIITVIIIIIIPFLCFTNKLNTQKQNSKIANKLQNKGVYIAIIIIIIIIKIIMTLIPLNVSNNNSVQFN
jgi:quinol-cytochrome oxidoreductase complex cytochrome b subunit